VLNVVECDREEFVQDLRTYVHGCSSKQALVFVHGFNVKFVDAILRTAPWRRSTRSFLTAPDIDADTFTRDVAPAILPTARRVTLYASSKDLALRFSKKVHGNQGPARAERTSFCSTVSTRLTSPRSILASWALLLRRQSIGALGHVQPDSGAGGRQSLRSEEEDERRPIVLGFQAGSLTFNAIVDISSLPFRFACVLKKADS